MPNVLLFADDALRIAAYTYSKPGFGNDNDDLSSYQSGKYFTKYSRQQRREPFANNWSQLKWSASQALWGVAPVSFTSARVQHGEILPTAVGAGTGLASFPALVNVISPAVRWFVNPLSLGAAGTGAVAALLAIKPAFALGQGVSKAVRYFSSLDYNLRHMELGGNYQDTETALMLRMRSVNEMSGALSYSRRWLGQESSYMHD